jgi:small subunit ribosomal protein S15
MALSKDKKANIISEYARGKSDTGSVEVQVAMLTERINTLTEHMKEHIHDYHTKLGLQKMVGKRKKLLSYLKDEDVARYRELIKKLNLRK